MIVVTETSGKVGSQKEEQLETIRNTICSKFDLLHFGVRNIHICSGQNQALAVAACKAAVESQMEHLRMRKATIVTPNSCEKED